MNPPKCTQFNYIYYLIAAQKEFTATEIARRRPESQNPPPYDAFTHLLQRTAIRHKGVEPGRRTVPGKWRASRPFCSP